MKFERASGEAHPAVGDAVYPRERRAELEAIMSIVRARSSFRRAVPCVRRRVIRLWQLPTAPTEKKTRPGLTAWLSRSAHVRVSIAKQRLTAYFLAWARYAHRIAYFA